MKKIGRLMVLSFTFLFAFSMVLTAQEPGVEEGPVNPDSSLMLGGRFSDESAESIGDLLLPALGGEAGVLYVNPRFVLGDEGEREFNGGLVFRRLEPSVNGIIGGNVYYDYRETASDATFDQLGFGIEYLGDLFDFRANYYLPEDDVERVNERVVEDKSIQHDSFTAWDDPFARGNTIVQRGRVIERTTEILTRRTFFQNEAALEGWDAEAGMLLPCPDDFDLANVRIFGGYYHFEGELRADDVSGAKARVEARVLPSFALDVEWYEDDELYGGDYFFGARLMLPFELMGGPRIDREAWMTRPEGKPELASRMLEPVMRDWHVQTKSSEVQEDVTKRTTSTSVIAERSREMQQTLATEVIFVNNDSGNNDNPGTVDRPVENVTTGMNMGDRVFVMNTPAGYDVNLMIEDDLDLMGQGYPIGNDGRYLFGDSSYTRLRPANPSMPTILVDGNAGAGNVLVRGFDVKGCLNGIASSPYSEVVVAAENVPNLEIHDNRIHCGLLGIMGRYQSMAGTYSLDIHDNRFDHLGMGALAMSEDSSGSVEFRDNSIRTTAIGAGAIGMAGDGALSTMDLDMTGNDIGPGGLETLGSLLINTNGIVNILVGSFLGGPLDPSITAALDGIPPESPSLLGLAGVGISETGTMDLNAYIADNEISDNLLGIALGGYGMGARVDDAVIEDNVVIGGGTDALLEYVHEDLLTVPYDREEPFEVSMAGITALGLEYASMQNLTIRDNVIANELLGVAVAGVGDARMDNAAITGNSITDSGAGIFALAEGGTHMNDLAITGNSIDNSGLGEVFDIVTDHIPTSSVPPEFRPFWDLDVPDYGLAGIVAGGNLIYADDDTEMNNLLISDNLVRDNVLGMGIIGGPDMEMNSGTIAGNTIENSFAAMGLLFSDTEASDWTVTANSIDPVFAGMILLSDSALLDNMHITDNVLDESTVGMFFGMFDDTVARNVLIEDNIIDGGTDPDQIAFLSELLEAADLDDDLEEVLGMDEAGLQFPQDLPATGGYAGFVGMIDGADEVSVSLLNNEVSDNAVGLFLQSDNNSPDAQIDVFNNTGSGPFILSGTDYSESHGGNAPPLIIMP